MVDIITDPATYLNAIIGAVIGFILAPSSIKFLITSFKWWKSKRHWIVGEWNFYYFNFEDLSPLFFSEKWTIKRTITRFIVSSEAI